MEKTGENWDRAAIPECDPALTEARYEGYLAMQGNPCWLYLASQLTQRIDYLQGRLLTVKSWEEYLLVRGELDANLRWRQQVRELADPQRSVTG